MVVPGGWVSSLPGGILRAIRGAERWQRGVRVVTDLRNEKLRIKSVFAPKLLAFILVWVTGRLKRAQLLRADSKDLGVMSLAAFEQRLTGTSPQRCGFQVRALCAFSLHIQRFC